VVIFSYKKGDGGQPGAAGGARNRDVEVLVLPLRIKYIKVELSEPLRMEVRGAISGKGQPKLGDVPSSSNSLMERSPAGSQGWRGEPLWRGVVPQVGGAIAAHAAALSAVSVGPRRKIWVDFADVDAPVVEET
jgi:hypothetical protein